MPVLSILSFALTASFQVTPGNPDFGMFFKNDLMDNLTR